MGKGYRCRGYSCLTDDLTHSFISGKCPVELHHIFPGNPYRKYSDEDGYVVPLTPEEHRLVHAEKENRLYFQQIAQMHWEEHIGTREEFIARYMKSRL